MFVQFEVGKTYATRSLCDWDCIFSFTVISRTKHFVTLRSSGRDLRRKVRVSSFDPNTERCDPFGVYSMSPVLSASDDLVAEEVHAS